MVAVSGDRGWTRPPHAAPSVGPHQRVRGGAMRGTQAVPAIAGLGFATAVLLEFIAFPDGASSNDPAAAIAEYYSRQGGADLGADYLSFVATPLFLIFLCGATWTMSAAALRFLTAAAGAAAVFEL